MAWTQAEIDELRAAIASGSRTVAYADKTITYQSTADMLTVLAVMESEASGNSTEGARSTRVAFSRE